MTTDLDSRLRELRPTDTTIDNAFTPVRRYQLLTDVLDTSTISARRRVQRRTLVLVAAATALVVVAGVLLQGFIPTRGLSPLAAQPAAADSLDRLANHAAHSVSPAEPGPGQYRAVTTIEQQTGKPEIRHQAYVAADGWTWRKDTERGRRTWLLYPAAAQIDPRALPANSAEMEQTLRQQWLGTPSDEQGLFKLVGEIARSEIAPPKVRAAAIGVLASLARRPAIDVPGRKDGTTAPVVTVFTATHNGRPVTGARFVDHSHPGTKTTYWFDDATSELVSTEQQFADGGAFLSQVQSRKIVDQLPKDIAAKLGTTRVEKIIK
ncbi:MAG TPA: hypothetical protein VIP98_23995 [Microlunatus sp.]